MNEINRILIVDDAPDSLHATSRLLKSAGYEVVEAATGQDGLRLAQEKKPGLVLLDVNLPDLSGIQVCQRIKTDAALTGCLVVMVSATKTSTDDQVEGLAGGADGYIARPISDRELVARVQAMIRVKQAEDALRRSETRLRTLTAHTPAYICEIDSAGTIQFANRTYEGISNEQAVGTNLLDWFPENQRAAIQSALDHVFASALPQSIEYTIPDPQGEMRSYATTLAPVLEGEQVGRAVLTAIDITERKQTEDALRKSENQYRLLFNTMLDGFALHDIICDEAGNPRDYRFLQVNPAFEKQTGLCAADIIGRTVRQVLPNIESPWTDIYGRVALTGEPAYFESYSRELDRHYQVVAFSPRPGQFAAIFKDVTEGKRAEQALRENEERLRLAHELLEAVTSGTDVIIAAQDTSFRYLYFNRVYQDEIMRLTGKAIHLGSSMVELFAHLPEQQEAAMREWSQPLRGESTSKTIVFGDSGRYQRIYNVRHTPIRDARGDVIGAGEVAYDVTEQVQTERALRASEERFRLVLKNAPVTVAAQDRDLRFLWAYNQRTVDPNAVIGKTDVEVFPPDVAARLMALKRQVLETETEMREQLWLTSGGRRMFLDLYFEPLRDAAGQVTGIGIATVDLTQIKLAEEALRESEERYRSLFNGMTEGFALHDIICDETGAPCDYRFLEINPAFERLTGLKREDVLGKTHNEVLPGDSPLWVEAYGAVALTGEPIHFEHYSPALGRHYEAFSYRPAPRQFAVLFLDVTERKRAEEALRRIEWMLTKQSVTGAITADTLSEFYPLSYGDLTALNTARLILDSVGRDALGDMVGDYLDLLGTSSAMYEKNGDYALGIFASGWCQFLDLASRQLCETQDNREALCSGRWHCHESCWKASQTSIETGQPVDVECAGGIRLFAVPIRAGDDIIGSINFGYGDPPTAPGKLQELAATFKVSVEELRQHAAAYGSRPPFIIELARNRLVTSARLIGLMVERKQAEQALRCARDELETRVQQRTQELAKANEELRLASAYNRSLIEAGLDPLVTIGPDGKITDVNAATENITGHSRANLIGTDFSDYFTEPDRAQAGYQQVFREGMVRDYALELRHRDGHVTSVLYNASVYRDEAGQVIGVFAAARDITVRKRMEEAERHARQIAETLSAANLALTQTLDVETVTGTLLDYVERLVPYDSANVMLLEAESCLAVRVARGYERWGNVEQVRAITFDVQTNPIFGELFTTRKSILVPDTGAQPGWETRPGAEYVRSWLGVPLIAGGNVIGIYSLDKTEPGFFTQEHVRLAEMLVGQAAVAIQNAWLFEQVRAGRERLQSLSHRLVQVQETERGYIARELHDEASQSLTTLLVGLRLLKEEANQPEAIVAGVDELSRMVEQVLEDLHRLAMDLRPASLDHLGLVTALRQHINAVSRKHGLIANFETAGLGDERLPLAMETNLYRIVQEALTNVVRYARATRVDVLLERRGDQVIAVIKDDGVGFDPSAARAQDERLGLFGMRERAEMLGGLLVVESAAGAGTTVSVEVPYDYTRAYYR